MRSLPQPLNSGSAKAAGFSEPLSGDLAIFEATQAN